MDGFVTLDVGCGEHFRGDVNVDRFINPTMHRNSQLNPGEIQNFVLADAQHLPFKSACFEKVVSSHVIEHVPEPMLMLKEMVRVSNRYIMVKCPHRFTLGTKNKAHIHRGFNPSWFRKAFQTLNCQVLRAPVRYGLFGIPEEVSVKAEKTHGLFRESWVTKLL